MEGDHFVLCGMMQVKDRDGSKGWLKTFIPLLEKRLESDRYKITILFSSYLFLPLLSSCCLLSFFLHINLYFNFSFNLLIKINKILLLINI